MAYKPSSAMSAASSFFNKRSGSSGSGGGSAISPARRLSPNRFLEANLAKRQKQQKNSFSASSYTDTQNRMNQLRKSAGLTKEPYTPKRTSSGSKSSSSNASSYNYNPPPPVENYQSSSMKGTGSAKDINNWVNSLKKELGGDAGSPDLPGQINLDKYRTEIATIKDLEKKYGFDYSRDYAERQAEIMAQAQRDQIQSSRERAEYETESAKTDLEHDFFNQYLQQRQELANTGLNAGIAAERDLRLGMNRDYALADILANEQLYNQELDRNLSTIDKEEQAYAEQLYNDRLEQAFGMSMDYSRFNQSENQWQAQMEMQQRNQQAEEAWREFEFNNMSYSERVKLIADAEKYGMDKAWDRHKFDAGLAFEAGQSGGGGAIQGDYSTSKGNPPQSFQNHLSQAVRAAGVDQSWIKPMSQLVANESTWNPSAKNPNSTAHGYMQFLNSTRSDYEKKYGITYDNPVNQLILGIRYIQDRYGTPQKALNFWNKNKWY